jgi:hypothetical protein
VAKYQACVARQARNADARPAAILPQDFMRCVEVTHATWMFHHAAFKDGGFQGDELWKAKYAHARMGYNFHVPTVSLEASTTSTRTVDVDVKVQQIGVAPFYYDLGLCIKCAGMSKKVLAGVDALIEKGSSKIFSFTGIPATSACLNAVTITLESSYAYSGRPIKFAQGNGALVLRLPLPSNARLAPSRPAPAPVRRPITRTKQVKKTQLGSTRADSLAGNIFDKFRSLLRSWT